MLRAEARETAVLILEKFHESLSQIGVTGFNYGMKHLAECLKFFPGPSDRIHP